MGQAADDKKVGFIGLGNVGAKLAGSLLRNGVDLTIRDLDRAAAAPLRTRARNGRTARNRWQRVVIF